ncbi:MAG: hypothetical protein AAF224_14965 [Pseudomonadota bacterium]
MTLLSDLLRSRAFIGAMMLLTVSMGLFLLPVPQHEMPTFRKNAAAEQSTLTDQSLEVLAQQFDLSELPPEPTRKTPPPDPIAAINGHRLIGVALTEDDAVAIIEVNNRRLQVREGDTVSGFIVTQLSPRTVHLQKGEIKTSLTF